MVPPCSWRPRANASRRSAIGSSGWKPASCATPERDSVGCGNWSGWSRHARLPRSDLDRTAAFYAHAGYTVAGRHDDSLLLANDGVELHFAQHDSVTPGTCFVHVADATKLSKQLHERSVDGVGEITDQNYGLLEFVLTDPGGNRIRIGSPRP